MPPSDASSPVPSDPYSGLPALLLEVRRLVEYLNNLPEQLQAMRNLSSTLARHLSSTLLTGGLRVPTLDDLPLPRHAQVSQHRRASRSLTTPFSASSPLLSQPEDLALPQQQPGTLPLSDPPQ